jgi:hypothetical protein
MCRHHGRRHLVLYHPGQAFMCDRSAHFDVGRLLSPLFSFSLHWAAQSQSAEVCRLLLVAGASPNARNRHNWTPLQVLECRCRPCYAFSPHTHTHTTQKVRSLDLHTLVNTRMYGPAVGLLFGRC